MLYKGIFTDKTSLISHPYIPLVLLGSKVDYVSKGYLVLKDGVIGSNSGHMTAELTQNSRTLRNHVCTHAYEHTDAHTHTICLY